TKRSRLSQSSSESNHPLWLGARPTAIVIVSNPLTLRVYKDFSLDSSTAIDWEFVRKSVGMTNFA
ncbi:hypothetical protein, partial [Coleofasciculus sp.]|uniref:hypothetical protein n=1 Tax=Coleofasciculus sp. TaxID=3100458 RepID=UPI0039F7C2AB